MAGSKWMGLLLAGVILLFAGEAATAARGRPRINSSGTTLVADNGNLLRGPQMSTDAGTLSSVANILAVTNLGCNAMHLYAEAAGQGYAAGAQSNLVDTVVNWTATNGLYLIITVGGGGSSASFATNFWNFYAGRYANQSHVIYEIQNEPTTGAPSSTAVIFLETNCYNIIRSEAPNTPVLLFSYEAFNSGSGVVQDVRALGGVVGWTNEAIAFHGYGSGGANGMQTCLTYVLKAGYPCFQTEFYRWPWGTGNFSLGSGASMYQDVTETGILERLSVSWLTFVSSGNFPNSARFATPMQNAGILWTPDYGIWPAGNRGAYGNGGAPWWTTNISSTIRIEAENFDSGGESIAYFDTTPGNMGGAYRLNEDVDIETTLDLDGGYDVSWIVAGEWLEYTTYINYAGLYYLKLRVASPQATNQVSVSFAGTNLTGTIYFPGTGGKQSWVTITNTVFLTPGQQIMRVDMLTSGLSLNWFELTPVGQGAFNNGTYKLINRNSGLAMEVAGAATTNGARLDQLAYGANSNQQWHLSHDGGNQYVITSGQTGNAIDESSYTALSGNYIQTWASGNSANQRWIIMPTDSNFYKIVSVNSGLVLEVSGAGTNAGAIIDQAEYQGGAHQQWSVQAPQIGVNVAPTNLVASVSGGSLVLSWPLDQLGWHLQVQTNGLHTGSGASWVDLTNTESMDTFTNRLNLTNGSVFYRLAFP